MKRDILTQWWQESKKVSSGHFSITVLGYCKTKQKRVKNFCWKWGFNILCQKIKFLLFTTTGGILAVKSAQFFNVCSVENTGKMYIFKVLAFHSVMNLCQNDWYNSTCHLIHYSYYTKAFRLEGIDWCNVESFLH